MKLEEKVDMLRKAEISARVADWRRYVPLSNQGLVDIEEDAGPLGHRTLMLTTKGSRELVRGLRALAARGK